MPNERPPATSSAIRLLGVCGSLKPAPGRSQPSACREILSAALSVVGGAFPGIEMLDLRETNVPPFEGLAPSEHPDPIVMECHRRIARAAGLVLSVPAYWGGLGGAFKSFVETVCGPPYAVTSVSPFKDRPAVVLIVGSDPFSAAAAADQAPALLEAVGTRLAAPLVVLGDPTDEFDRRTAFTSLVGATASLACECLRAAGDAQ